MNKRSFLKSSGALLTGSLLSRLTEAEKEARTNWAGPDTLITSLENSLTPAEQTMVDLGELPRLRDMRMFFQYASEDRFRELIERLTHREVRGFVSGVDVERDLAAEIFYLVPRPEGDSS